ncbi:MAG: formylglycine-generating enzyme family protein [Polyangiales bacterium]
MALILATSTPACAAISGFGDLEKVDCVGDGCGDASLDTSAADTLGVDTSVEDSTIIDTSSSDTSSEETASQDSSTPDTSTLDTSTLDTGTPDTGTPDTGSPDSGSDAGACGSTAGPTMVKVGSFCIDSTEVTNAQYKAFLAGTPGPQPSYCSWNTLYIPAVGWPYAAGRDNYPVTNVDWCDAYAYCKWAGKRLCGKIGGGTNAYDAYATSALSQWYYACSGGTGLTYPYGSTLVSMRCQDGDIMPNQSVPVATKPLCVGGFPGLYDMSGNAWELEDSCDASGDAAGPAADHCHVRGGSYTKPTTSDALKCDGDDFVQRSDIWPFVGFRCCSP